MSQLPVAATRQAIVVHNDVLDLMDTGKFEHMQRVARVISMSSLLPKHLQGTTPEATHANCFRVLDQAARWGFNPFSVVDATYVVSGKLGYEGKLVAAVINARGGLHDGLLVNYNSEAGPKKAAVIFGSSGPIPKEARPLLKKYLDTGDGEAVNALINDYGVKAIRISVEQASTSNQMWTKDPEQKLFYTGATKWARRFKPEMLLGVLTEDDLERLPQYGEGATPLPTHGGKLNGAAEQPKAIEPTPEPKAAEQPKPVEPPKQEPAPMQPGEVPNDAPTGDANEAPNDLPDESAPRSITLKQLEMLDDERERLKCKDEEILALFDRSVRMIDDASAAEADRVIAELRALTSMPRKGKAASK